MPRYKINVSPTVSRVVEADNIEEAKRIVTNEIVKGVVSPIYDDLYFDYTSGVDDRQLRRELAIADNDDDKRAVLTKRLGSDGFIQNTKGDFAITPEGMTELGLPFKSISLQDGYKVNKNTVIDAKGVERADLADFMGITGPIVGAIAAFSPQLRIIKGLTSLLGGNKPVARILTSGIGTAGGKGVEETVEYTRGVQTQEAEDIRKLLGTEFLLGFGGQTLGEGVGAAFKYLLGPKLATNDIRSINQASKGRSQFDINKLDKDLGRPATEKEIQKAIKDGKVFVGDAFRASFGTLGARLPARGQQILEEVTGRETRVRPSTTYLMNEVKRIGNLKEKEVSLLTDLVDDYTAGRITSQVDDIAKSYSKTEKDLTKELKFLVEDIVDRSFATGNYKNAPGVRELGNDIRDVLAEAKKTVNQEVGAEYAVVDSIFDQMSNPLITNSVRKEVNSTINQYAKEAKQIIENYKETDVFWRLNTPGATIDSNTIMVIEKGLDDLINLSTNQKATLTQVRNAIDGIREQSSILPLHEQRIVKRVLRKLDDSDVGGSDSILTSLEKNGASKFKVEIAKQNAQVLARMEPKIDLTQNDTLTIRDAITLLRRANEKSFTRNLPFDNAVLARIKADALTKGATDADEIFSKLIYSGTRKDLEDFFDALAQYDDYARNILKDSTKSNNVNYLKSQIKKRLFADAFQNSTDVNTGNINFGAFVRSIRKFDSENEGKLEILFSDKGGKSVANKFRQTIAQLSKIDPKLRASEVKKLVDELPKETGLTASSQGEKFIDGLDSLAQAAARRESFITNKNISELPSKPVDEIVETIFRPGNSRNIEFIKENVDADTFKKIQDASYVRLLKDSIDFGHNDRGMLTDVFRHKNLSNTLEKYGDRTLESMFGKEVTTGLKGLVETIDLLTKGEPGRARMAGGIVAASFGIGLLLKPLAVLTVVPAIAVLKEIISSPRLLRALTKTDYDSISAVIDGINAALLQTGARGVDFLRGEIKRETSDLIQQARDTDEFREIQSQVRQPISPPQTQIPLPIVEPAPRAFEQDEAARRDFARRLFGEEVI
jgi:hypothetical protein